MKKYFKYLLIGIFSFICLTNVLNAETLECRYAFEANGNNDGKNASKIRLKFDVNTSNQTYTVQGRDDANFDQYKNMTYWKQSYNEGKDGTNNSYTPSSYKNDNNLVKVASGDSFYYVVFGTNKPGIIDTTGYIGSIRVNGVPTYQELFSNGVKCPNLRVSLDHNYEENGKIKGTDIFRAKVNKVMYDFAVIYTSVGNVGMTQITSSGESITGDQDNTNNKTTYRAAIDSTSIANLYSFQQTTVSEINIITTAYSDGKYHIKMNESCSSGNNCYVNENDDIVWSNGSYVIFKEDWNSLKAKMPFDSSKTGQQSVSLYITPVQTGGFGNYRYYYSVTANGNSNKEGVTNTAESSEANGNYDIDADPKFKVIDKVVSSNLGSCVNYLGEASNPDSVAGYLQKAFNIIKVVAILLAIVFSMIDFSGAITSDKTDVKKTGLKCAKRLIVVLVLLLLPTLIDMVGNIIGITDILCGIK